MDIREIIYQFRLKAEQINTAKSRVLRNAQIIIFLNDAQLKILKNRYGVDNYKRQGFEMIQRRTEELQHLLVSHETLKYSGLDKKRNIVKFDLSKTKEKFMILTRVSFDADTADCSSLSLDGVPVQTDDLNEVLRDVLNNPSLEWRELPYRQADNKLMAYSTPEILNLKADIDYLRFPKRMDIEGYSDFDKKPSKTVQCELPELIHPDLIDTAVQIFKFSINSPDSATAFQNSLMNE